MTLSRAIVLKLVGLTLVAILALSLSTASADTLLNIDQMGEPFLAYEARAIAMGNACIALYDGANTSLLNPACSAQLSTTMFNATYLRYQTRYSLYGQESAVVEHNLPNISFTAFIPKIELPVTVGYRTYYDWGIKVAQPLIVEGEEVGEEWYIGKGSLNCFSVASARRLLPWMSLGLRLDYYFGAPKEAWIKDFSSDYYTDVRDVLEHRMHGASFTVGAVGSMGMGLDVGFFYQHKAKLDVEDTVTSNFGVVAEDSYTLTYPARMGFGIAYRSFPWLTAAIDVIHTRWSGFEGGNQEFDFQSTTEFHGGVEIVPSQNPKSFKLLRLPYRVGFYYIPWYGADPGGGRYSEVGFTFGMGYLFGQNENSRVDVAFEFGRRGGGDLDLQEDIFRLYFSVSALEKWLGKFTKED